MPACRFGLRHSAWHGILWPKPYVQGGIELSGEVLDGGQSHDGRSRGLKETTESAGKADHWLVWWLALAAVAIPVIVLFSAASIPKDSLIWSQVAIAVQRGDFLVPVLILSLDTMRRWLREVECGTFLRIIKPIACALCVGAAFICLIATSQAASLAITADAGKAIEQITMMCMVVPLSFGTLAVSISASQEQER